MSDSEFYHEALIRRIRERDDCDDDLRGACDEIEGCYETIKGLRLTDAEREAVEQVVDAANGEATAEPWAVATLRGLLERLG